jgi:malonate transporter and related proteins
MHIALSLLPDFALILLGAALRRAMHLGDHFWSGLEKLIYFVLFPALLFNAIARVPIEPAGAAPLVLTGAGILGSGMLLGLLARGLFPALTPISFASQFQCAFRYNSYIGLAVAGKLYGAAGIASMGLLVGTMVPLANIASVWMLARHGEAGIWKELSRNPLILATFAGLAWNLAGLPYPDPARQFLGRLSEASIALGLLAVGAALKLGGSLAPTHGERSLGIRLAAGYLLVVKLAVLPLVAITLARLLALTPLNAGVVLAFAALPTATSAYILAQRMGGDGARVAWLVSASTLIAMVTLPAWLVLAL